LGKILDSIRRRFLITVFAVAAAVSARGQTQPVSPSPIQQDSVKTLNVTPVDPIAYIENMPAEDLRTADKMLIEDARDNFIHLLPYMQTDYSADLKKIQDSTNAYLARHGFENQSVIVFDPVKFDVMEGLSLSKEEAAGAMLKQEINREAPSSLITSASSIKVSHSLPTGESIYIEEAHAFYHEMPDGGSYVTTIVPIAPHALPYNIKGLTVEENVEFANKHEAWHCIDFLMNISEQLFKKLPDAQAKNERQAIFCTGDRQSLIISHSREAFADIAALGDMIREGKNPEIIDAVIAWRISYSEDSPSIAEDVGHLTPLALQALKKEINKMGLEAFRDLSEDEARQIYMDIVADEGLSPRLLRKYTGYEKNNPQNVKEIDTGLDKLDKAAETAVKAYKGFRRLMYKAESLVNGETRDMFKLRKLMSGRKPTNYLPMTEQQEEEINQLTTDWNAQTVLYDRSMKDYGKITPISLIQTYCTLQDEMLQAIGEDTSIVNYMATATKMAELQREFINKLDTEDYLLLNAEKGVDLFKTEFCLSPFSPKAPPNRIPNVTVSVPGVKTP
jgi:hypothetical protein